MDHQQIHAAVIGHLRTQLASTAFSDKLATWDDELMLHRLFSNYRGERGLRLTQFGHQIMQHCFQSYEFENTNNEKLRPIHLLFLDRHAKMPYFCDRQKLVVYDKQFAVYLRLVGGDLAALTAIDIID
jgi:hypothetical protein